MNLIGITSVFSIKNWLPFIVILSLSPVVFANQLSLRVGVDLTYPPFQSTDKTGHPAGFEIDLTNALCKSINANVTTWSIRLTLRFLHFWQKKSM